MISSSRAGAARFRPAVRLGQRLGLPAVAVLQRHQPLQPVPLRPRGRRADQRLRPRRRRRGPVHLGGRRRLPPRRGRAAQVARAGLRRPVRGPGPEHRRGEGRHVRLLPHAGRRLRPSGARRRVLLLRNRRLPRPGALGRRTDRHGRRRCPIASRFISREHYLMWRPAAHGRLRAGGPLLRPLRPAPGRALRLRPPRHRLQPARGDLQPLGRLSAERAGSCT